MSQNDAVEGVGGRPDDGVHPHVQQWRQYQDYQDHLDELDAAEALARQGHVAGAGPVSPFEQVAARVAGVAAAAAPEFNEDDRDARTNLLAAMQQKALERLEAPVQADAVNAAVRAADRLDVAAGLEAADELNTSAQKGCSPIESSRRGRGRLPRRTTSCAE